MLLRERTDDTFCRDGLCLENRSGEVPGLSGLGHAPARRSKERSFSMALMMALLLAFLPLAVAGVAQARGADKHIAGVVNLNTADEAQLKLLPGVGPTRARAILAWRAKHRFTRPEELRRVKGFGAKTVAKLKGYLAVAGDSTLRSTRTEAPSPFAGKPATPPPARAR